MKRKNRQQNIELEPIFRLPNILKELISFYAQGQGQTAWAAMPLGAQPIFTGSGVDLLAAYYAARLCRQAGVMASAFSEAEIWCYPTELFSQVSSIVYIGESFESGLADKLGNLPCFQIKAEPRIGAEEKKANFSSAQFGDLGLVKSMALTWLLVRKSSGHWDGSESAKLQPVRQRAQLMADGCEAFLARCRDLLKYSPRWILLGGEEQQEVMQFTSLLLAKKANRLAPWALYADYAENFQQHVDPDTAIIHFRGADDPRVDVLLDQAEENGAVVVDVTEGFFAPHRSQKNFSQGVEPNLIPLLGCMAGNLLALADRIEMS